MGTGNQMGSFVYEIQSSKLFRPPNATGINIAPKTRPLPPALLWVPVMVRSLPLDDRDRGLKLHLNRRISAQARRPEAQKANPQPGPDLKRRDEEEDGYDEAELKRSAEALEHMEEEAMTGDDAGRDAVDYSRRARLFEKSSRVFQDLKERDDQSRGP